MLKISDLNITYNNRKILNDVSLQIGTKEIIGLLGPNGAGKTTLMKLICGLDLSYTGEIHINNTNLKKDRLEAISNISAMIENPKFYDFLTGKENLEQLARLELLPHDEVDNILKLVGLYNDKDVIYKKYSLGMKQRLYLAQAIMGNKKLLILDEPTNGLDANGILEFREILSKLIAEKDLSILISSHKLDEIEKICNKIIFINNGNILLTEDVKSIRNSTHKFKVYTDMKKECINIFYDNSDILNIAEFPEGVIITYKANSLRKIIEILIYQGIEFTNLITISKTLEERYLDILGGALNDRND